MRLVNKIAAYHILIHHVTASGQCAEFLLPTSIILSPPNLAILGIKHCIGQHDGIYGLKIIGLYNVLLTSVHVLHSCPSFKVADGMKRLIMSDTFRIHTYPSLPNQSTSPLPYTCIREDRQKISILGVITIRLYVSRSLLFFTFLTGRDSPLCSWVSGHVSKVGIYRGEIRSSYRRPHSRIPVIKSAPPGHLQTCPSTFLPPICPTTSICIGPTLLITTNQTYSVYVPGANTFSDFSYSIGWAATPARRSDNFPHHHSR